MFFSSFVLNTLHGIRSLLAPIISLAKTDMFMIHEVGIVSSCFVLQSLVEDTKVRGRLNFVPSHGH